MDLNDFLADYRSLTAELKNKGYGYPEYAELKKSADLEKQLNKI